MTERQTQSEKELAQIEQLVKFYLQSSSRQVLTRIRQSKTNLLKKSPLMVHRLDAMLEANRMSGL
jgi:hypothetical protein